MAGRGERRGAGRGERVRGAQAQPPPMFVIVVSGFRRRRMPGEGGPEEEPWGGSGGAGESRFPGRGRVRGARGPSGFSSLHRGLRRGRLYSVRTDSSLAEGCAHLADLALPPRGGRREALRPLGARKVFDTVCRETAPYSASRACPEKSKMNFAHVALWFLFYFRLPHGVLACFSESRLERCEEASL